MGPFLRSTSGLKCIPIFQDLLTTRSGISSYPKTASPSITLPMVRYRSLKSDLERGSQSVGPDSANFLERVASFRLGDLVLKRPRVFSKRARQPCS